MDLRTNSDYFPILHQLVGFYNRDGVCLLRGTDWGCKYIWTIKFNTQQFYVLPTQCFVWIVEQTAIIPPYSFNWLVFITEMGCVYCAVRVGSLSICTTRFNIQQFYVLPAQCIYVFCVDLRTNNDYLFCKAFTDWFL